MNDNNAKITEKLLLIKDQLQPLTPIVAQAAEKIKEEGISNYPIFVVHQGEAQIGIPLIDREKVNSYWSVNASTLEEFYAKSLISKEKLEEFKKLYKEHEGEVCFFVMSEIGAQYLFMPVKK